MVSILEDLRILQCFTLMYHRVFIVQQDHDLTLTLTAVITLRTTNTQWLLDLVGIVFFVNEG